MWRDYVGVVMVVVGVVLVVRGLLTPPPLDDWLRQCPKCLRPACWKMGKRGLKCIHCGHERRVE